MRAIGLHSAIAMLFGLLLAFPAAGQTSRPSSNAAAAKGDQAMEDQSLRITDSDVKAVTARPSVSSAAAAGTSDLTRVFIALLVVICVILVLRSAVRHLSVLPGSNRAGKLVTVLSRSIISPRQHVLVLQVGKRLLIVGDSGGRMNALCEISDPDEIAQMVGQTHQTRESAADRSPGSFTNIFRRANEPFTETEALAKPAIDPDEAVSSEEMTGLMEKVRMLQQQFRLRS